MTGNFDPADGKRIERDTGLGGAEDPQHYYRRPDPIPEDGIPYALTCGHRDVHMPGTKTKRPVVGDSRPCAEHRTIEKITEVGMTDDIDHEEHAAVRADQEREQAEEAAVDWMNDPRSNPDHPEFETWRREALEAENWANIVSLRTDLLTCLTHAEQFIERAGLALRHLASDHVYDVDVEGQTAEYINAALVQAKVGVLAALALAPRPPEATQEGTPTP